MYLFALFSVMTRLQKFRRSQRFRNYNPIYNCCLNLANLSQWPTWWTNFYYIPLHVHVSSSILLILRKSNCINTESGIVTLSKWPSGAQVQKELLILQVLLYQITTLFLHNFVLMFLYWYICFACFALQIFTFRWTCILVQPVLSQPVHWTVTYWQWWYQMLY